MQINMRMWRRENGYYYYEIHRGRKKSLGTKDKDEAKTLWKFIKKEHLAGRLADLDSGPRISLSEFKTLFFKQHTDIADDTVAAYDLAFRLLIETVGGATLLSRIDKSKIDEFKTVCLSRKAKKTSINTYLRHVRGFLNKAHEWGYLPQKAKIEFLKIPKRLPWIFTPDEIKKILKYAKKHEQEMYRVIQFALYTGCRRGEIWGLTWPRVSGDMARIIGKGDKERTIPLATGALEAMGPVKDIGPVFWHPPRLERYTKIFKAILRACKITDSRHFHNLRHTAGTQMLRKGIPIDRVQEMLGHEDITTTQIYARVLKEDLKREIVKLDYG